MMTAVPDTLSDHDLTEDGLRPKGDGRVLLLACGALAREILALIRLNGWEHMDLACLPAILHNHPEKITDAVRAAVDKHRANYTRICVVYADCGTGGLLQAACDEMGVQMVPGPHCYAFFDGLAAFEERDEITAFYLTDFLCRQFDAFVWKPLGLDRHPQLRDMYFGHYERLVYLAQTEDADLTARAEACAERMGLAFERRFTGYGDLAAVLEGWAKAPAA
ncbi:DUF1638 domain-containing protein [Mameliella alba]|nr:DUF1638 domain-containing protein [Antarctobacter heliothermus]MBY6144304.1 DUF1638 domain-containing protein [Mameliella alba]MBY6161405.1 DUF1638 domain-containing protein [Mameliella alba]MBY6170129.1 DUF1638 domain-containing protein [Mameliella alba]MBY6174894.1 DUF1638 domain-containing protein [Mameliella alba]